MDRALAFGTFSIISCNNSCSRSSDLLTSIEFQNIEFKAPPTNKISYISYLEKSILRANTLKFGGPTAISLALPAPGRKSGCCLENLGNSTQSITNLAKFLPSGHKIGHQWRPVHLGTITVAEALCSWRTLTSWPIRKNGGLHQLFSEAQSNKLKQ